MSMNCFVMPIERMNGAVTQFGNYATVFQNGTKPGAKIRRVRVARAFKESTHGALGMKEDPPEAAIRASRMSRGSAEPPDLPNLVLQQLKVNDQTPDVAVNGFVRSNERCH